MRKDKDQRLLPPFKHPLWWWIATWFGSGLSPIISGTAGSLAALPFATLIHYFFGSIALMLASFIIFFIGCWAAEKYVQAYQTDDPGEIVVDEVAGQWLLLSVLPFTWQAYLVGFILFRAFDIVKPWPVCWADRNIKGGLGVMFDDMLAAAYPILVYLLLMLEALLFNSQHLLAPLMTFLGADHV